MLQCESLQHQLMVAENENFSPIRRVMTPYHGASAWRDGDMTVSTELSRAQPSSAPPSPDQPQAPAATPASFKHRGHNSSGSGRDETFALAGQVLRGDNLPFTATPAFARAKALYYGSTTPAPVRISGRSSVPAAVTPAVYVVDEDEEGEGEGETDGDEEEQATALHKGGKSGKGRARSRSKGLHATLDGTPDKPHSITRRLLEDASASPSSSSSTVAGDTTAAGNLTLAPDTPLTWYPSSAAAHPQPPRSAATAADPGSVAMTAKAVRSRYHRQSPVWTPAPAAPASSYYQRSAAATTTTTALALALPADMWQPDTAADCCQAPGCGAEFNLWTRRHHCRCCGQLVCGPCSSRTSLLAVQEAAAPTTSQRLRVCDECWDSLRATAHRRSHREQAPRSVTFTPGLF